MSLLDAHRALLQAKIEAMTPGAEAGLVAIVGDDWNSIGTVGQRKHFGRQFKSAVADGEFTKIVWVRIENSGRYDVYRKL